MELFIISDVKGRMAFILPRVSHNFLVAIFAFWGILFPYHIE